MADEGATIYYTSKQKDSFGRACNYFNKSGLFIQNPDTKLITGIDKGDFSETSKEKVQELIYQSKEVGLELWLETNERIFWSFIERNNFLLQNFTFNYLNYDDIEQKISKIFVKFALQELKEANKYFLSFTLDQFGHYEDYDFSKIFEPENNEILSHHYISDITFLPRDKIKRISLNDECQIISINQQFDCIAKNQELADYVRSLL